VRRARVSGKMNKPSPTDKALAVVPLTLVLVVLLLISLSHGQPQGSLRVSYIDVGQGDGILLHGSDDTDVLIGAGPPAVGPTVVAYLQSEGVDDVDVMVLTYANDAHIGGLVDVLSSTIPVEFAIYPYIYGFEGYQTETFKRIVAEMRRRGKPCVMVSAPHTYTWGMLDAVVVNPVPMPTEHPPDNSVVLLVIYGDVRFLFTADITAHAEQIILDRKELGTWLEAHVLKVARHGDERGSSAPFLEAVGADLAVISVGDNARPAQETLERLQAVGARVLRTDRNGTIVVTTDGQTYEVRTNSLIYFPAVIRMPTPTPTPDES
jgi:competence protein ComEC